MLILCYILYYDSFEYFSMHKGWGAFGLFHHDQLSVTWGLYGPSHGFFGNAGYLICLNYFSPVIVSAAFLMEPSIGQCIGYWFDIDKLPSWMTWLGALGVIIGIGLVQYGEYKRKKIRVQ